MKWLQGKDHVFTTKVYSSDFHNVVVAVGDAVFGLRAIFILPFYSLMVLVCGIITPLEKIMRIFVPQHNEVERRREEVWIIDKISSPDCSHQQM